MRDMTTWREMLKDEFALTGDTFEKMKTTLTQEELDFKFDCGYGGSEGPAFTAWGEKYVYFPVVYDGSEWVGSAPRFPRGKIKTQHHGGQ